MTTTRDLPARALPSIHMAGFSVEHFPALMKLCELDCEGRASAFRNYAEDFKPLLALYGTRGRTKLLSRLSPVKAKGTTLTHDIRIVLPVQMWKFASNYACFNRSW